jgi:putative ABC transport system permease protein
MNIFLQDLRYGMRQLMKHPSFTFITIITLALGIGANTAIFSVVNAVMLKPLPYRDAEELVVLWEKMKQTDTLDLAPDDFVEYRERLQSFEQFAASSRQGFTLTGDDEPQRIDGASITANMFQMLGVAPQLGRDFDLREDKPGADRVAILSYGLWQRRFGGDQKILNQIVTVDGEPRTVIGIMPPDFQFPPALSRGNTPEAKSEMWVPMVLENETQRNSHYLLTIGRLKKGTPIEQAKAEINTIAEQRDEKTRASHQSIGANALLLHEQVVRKIRPALMILLGAVGFVLLIACANVASLLLIRATARQKEIAIRSALGAGRARLIRQLLLESLLLALPGGMLGLLLADWSNSILIKLGANNIPRTDEIGIDTRVLLFTITLSLLTGIIFGLIPALKASSLNLVETLKEGGRSATSSTGRIRSILMVAEVALALVLLVGAGLLIKSFWQLQHVDPGFNANNLLVMETTLPTTRYPEEPQQRAFYQKALEQISSLPGVESVAIVNNPPLSGRRGVDVFTIAGQPPPTNSSDTPLADYRAISTDYFQVMGIKVVDGRAFTSADDANAPAVVIVNQATVRRYFQGENPVGKQVRLRGNNPLATIVGVVTDIRQSGLDEQAATHIYYPYWQHPQTRMGWVVRTTTEPMSLLASIRNQIYGVDREQPVNKVQTMEKILADSVAQRRLNMLLLGVFATTALLLSLVGIYGLIAHSVSQRLREIGIRLALGAQKGDVLRLMLKQGMRLAMVGITIGLGAALLLTRFLSTLLLDVNEKDPMIFIAVALLVAVVALLACYIPARRATKVDPLVALRYE